MESLGTAILGDKDSQYGSGSVQAVKKSWVVIVSSHLNDSRRPEETVDHPFTNDFLATLVHVWQSHYWTFLLLNYEDIMIYRTSWLQCKWPGDKNVISQLLAMASYRELPPLFLSLISPLRRGPHTLGSSQGWHRKRAQAGREVQSLSFCEGFRAPIFLSLLFYSQPQCTVWVNAGFLFGLWHSLALYS